MGEIRYCPMLGDPCNKPIKVQENTFFLAEPFEPGKDKQNREKAVETAIKDALGKGFSEDRLKIADNEPTTPAFFCDICRMIQSSAYGIADISGLNPNVLIELGMMFSLSKPVFILVKKDEEEDVKKKLPSDIPWKRAVPYGEFIEIVEELSKQIKKRPKIEAEPSPIEEIRDGVLKIAPSLAKTLNSEIEKFSQSQQERLAKLENLLKEAKLDKPIVKEEAEATPPSLERRIKEILEKVEQMEKLTGFPENPDIALLRGNFYYERKEYRKALELYDWATTLKPNFAEAWNNKGVSLVKLEKYEEAIACYDKAIKLKPDDAEAWYNKGADLGKLEKYEEAIACYDKAIKLKPNNVEAWYNKGVTIGKLEKYEEAIACYDEAIKLKPDNADAWNNKGTTLGKLKRWQEARQCYEEALRIAPNYVSAMKNLSEALLILGDIEGALKRLNEGMRTSKKAEDKAICQFLQISALTLKGKNEQASRKTKQLINYLKKLKKGFKVTTWDFSHLSSAIEKKLGRGDKKKIFSLVSLLKGEITIKEFEKDSS